MPISTGRKSVTDAAIAKIKILLSVVAGLCRPCRRVKPVFVEEWADFGFNDLLKPFSSVTDRYLEGRRHIAVANSKLAAEAGICRDLFIQGKNSLLNLQKDLGIYTAFPWTQSSHIFQLWAQGQKMQNAAAGPSQPEQ